ncbi:LysR substrate-binding domain-containing protein [Streptomyces sp. L7]
MPTALTLLRDAHPRLRVEVTQAEPKEALPALLARDFDLVITEEYPGNPHPRPAELEHEPLCEDPLRLATPRPVDRDAGPMDELRALADHPWVMEPEGSPARHWATALCRTAGFEPDVRFESADLVLHLRLAELGHAAALLPDLAWNGAPAHRRAATAPRGASQPAPCSPPYAAGAAPTRPSAPAARHSGRRSRPSTRTRLLSSPVQVEPADASPCSSWSLRQGSYSEILGAANPVPRNFPRVWVRALGGPVGVVEGLKDAEAV